MTIRLKRRTFTAGLAAFMASGTLTKNSYAASGENDTRPDINIAFAVFPRTLDPAMDPGGPEIRVYYSIYDTLIRRDFSNPLPGGGARLIPGLATSWEWTTPRTLDMKLREGVVCHDGNPFTAEDVLTTFSADRLLGPDAYFPLGNDYFNMIEKVEALDAHKVRFTLNRNDIAFENRLSSTVSYIIGGKQWNAFKKEGVPVKEWAEEAFAATNWKPVGTGPYKFVDMATNDYVKLESNDDYWGGRPAAKSITFRTVPEVASRISGLVVGDYDISLDVPPEQWEGLSAYPDITLKVQPMETAQIFVLNQSDPVIADRNLRQALSLAINRQVLIDTLWKGRSSLPVGHQHPSYGQWYITDRNGKGYVYDPERAKQLLAESKYKGEEISYRVIPGYYLNNLETAQVLQEMWRAVGINVRLDYFNTINDIRKTPGLQLYNWQNTYRIPDPTGQIILQWGPGSVTQVRDKTFVPPEGFNELCDKIAGSLDVEQRKKDIGTLLDMFEESMPASVTNLLTEGTAMRNKVHWNPYSQFIFDGRPDVFSIDA
jgi:peptide/nickel transport system substrate-binding protein